MNKLKTLCALALASALTVAAPIASSAESVTENVKEMGRDVKKNTKEGYRAMKDKACELVNGKLECLGDRAKHRAQDAGGEIKDKADDLTKDN